MVVMRTIVRPSRASSEPMRAARSASDGSGTELAPQLLARGFELTPLAAHSTRPRVATQGVDHRATDAALGNVSNLMPRSSSKRHAASINPSMPSCTRSPSSIECGIEAATLRAQETPRTEGRRRFDRAGWLRVADASGLSFGLRCPLQRRSGAHDAGWREP